MSAFFHGFAEELLKLADFVTGTDASGKPTFKKNPEPVQKSGLTPKKIVQKAQNLKPATKAALTGLGGSSQSAKQVRKHLPQD